MSAEDVLLTTTDSFEGFEIQEYIGMVYCESYENMNQFIPFTNTRYGELDLASIMGLRESAFNIGGNGVVGITVSRAVDYSKVYIISTAIGTAVKIRKK